MRDLRLRRRTRSGSSTVRTADEHDRPRARPRPRRTATTTTHAHVEPRPGPAHPHARPRVAVLAKNDELAAHNRAWLAERGIAALNLMSSPGAGQDHPARAHHRRAPHRPVSVIEGDQETLFDAERIRARRAPARSRSTPAPAATSTPTMVARGARGAATRAPAALVFIENVGNLVCPALFDLGEAAQGRGHLGDRGRRQAAEVPAHVRRRRPGRGQQDRPAAVRRLRRSTGSPPTPARSTRTSQVLPSRRRPARTSTPGIDWLRREPRRAGARRCDPDSAGASLDTRIRRRYCDGSGVPADRSGGPSHRVGADADGPGKRGGDAHSRSSQGRRDAHPRPVDQRRPQLRRRLGRADRRDPAQHRGDRARRAARPAARSPCTGR